MRIGIIAGNGQFPILFSKAAKVKGYRVFAVAHKNETNEDLNDTVDTVEWIHIGQIKRIIKFFKNNNIICFIKYLPFSGSLIFSYFQFTSFSAIAFPFEAAISSSFEIIEEL